MYRKCYAVIDTSVLLSALISKSDDAAAVRVLDAVLHGRIIPLYHQEILDEYNEVLHREKFHLSEKIIQNLLGTIVRYGLEIFPQPTGDLIFYEVAMEKRDEDAYLVTGNRRHYPIRNLLDSERRDRYSESAVRFSPLPVP